MKKKLLRIFLFIMTLLSCIVPSEINGPIRKVDAFSTDSANYTKYVYFTPNSNWSQSSATFKANFYENGSYKTGIKMSRKTIGSTSYWFVENPYEDYYDSIQFLRMDSSGNSQWNYSASFKLSTEGKNLITQNSNSGWDNWGSSGVTFTTVNDASVEYYDGSTKLETVSGVHGYTKFTNKNYTKTGYTLDGWYDSTLTTKYTTDHVMWANPEKVYAKWTANTYTIKFDGNGNTSGTMSDLPASYGTSKNLTTNAFQKTGYSFTGWNSNANGSGDTYNDRQSVSNLTTTNGGSVTLYAQWTPVSYSISYTGLENATITTNPSSYNIETNTFTLNNPTKTGYTFLGWTGSNGNTPSKTVSIDKGSTGDKSYTANWEIINYSITYQGLESATITTNPSSYNIETNTFTLNNPTKTGYTFLGWTGSNGNTPSTNVSISKGSTGSKTYTANWKINQYGITLNVAPTEGGTTTGSGTYDYNSNVQISASPNIGYQFVKWNDGNTNSSRTITLGASDVTYTASFSPKTYVIRFKTNESNYLQNNYSITYGQSIGDLPTDSTPPSGDYVLLGWYLDPNDEDNKNVINGTILNKTNFNIQSNDSNEITLYAKYKQLRKFTVSFDSNGGSNVDSIQVFETLTYGFNNPSFPSSERTGYEFVGWTYNGNLVNLSDELKVQENHTLVASWSPNQYTISYDVNTGDTTHASNQVTFDSTYGTLPTPTKTGYTFLGWFTQKEGGTEITSSTKVTTAANQTLYAHWQANTYTITFDKQTGIGGDDSTTVTYDANNYSVAIPSKEGHSFQGYFTETNGGGTKYYNADGSNAKTWNIPNDTTLYAHWKTNPYTISFNSNGGSNVNSITQNYGTTVNAPTDPTRTGYTFEGWYSNQELTNKYTFSTIPAEDITLYAKWTINQYSISFDSNGGSTVDTITQDYNSAVTLPTPTRTGYTFEGWLKNGVSYTTSTIPAENISLTAKWSPITYTIILDSNNTSGITHTVTATYDSLTTLSFGSFTQNGYEIIGWSDSYDGEILYSDTLAANQNLSSTQGEEIRLYAIWDIKTYNITYSYADELNDVTHNNVKGYTILSDSIKLNEPTRENYTFAGWTCASLGITEPTKNFVIPTGTYGDLTIVANWEQKITVYIDMSKIYEQYSGKNKIEAPFIYYYAGSVTSGTFGQQKMTYVENNIFKYDIYFTKNNVPSELQEIEHIIFGYYQIGLNENYDSQNDSNYTRPQTSAIEFNVDPSCNGKEYLFIYDYEEAAILTGFKVGKTYTITVTGYSHEDGSQKAKWYNYTISESNGTAGKTTFKLSIPSNWSNIGDVYFQPMGVNAGIKASGSNNNYTVTLDYATYGSISAIQCNFEQDSYWWYHLYDSYHYTETNTYTYASSDIYSISLIEAPRVNYYDGNTLVHSSSFVESNQVHFVEKEGYKLEGWYTTPTFEPGTKFEKGYEIVGSIDIYANYVVAHDYFIYVEAKNIGWDMENMSVYKWSNYFSSHDNSWPGSKDDIVYLGNGMYRVFIDASKSFDKLIFCDSTTMNANGNKDHIVQTEDITMTPSMSYYVISGKTYNNNDASVGQTGRHLNPISYEKSLDNDIYAQKNSSNTSINEFRFTSGLEDYDDLVEIPQDTVGKEFGYKFIFINGDECYVGYWNFSTNTMLDCVRYDDTLYEATANGYKGYYSLTLTDDINFKYSHYNQIIVVACYRDNSGNTQIIKAQEYNIVGTGTNVHLYEIER